MTTRAYLEKGRPVAPVRVQLRRTRGWRMPPNTVKVTRPGPFGNPFKIGEDAPSVYARFHTGKVVSALQAVNLFRKALVYELGRETPASDAALDLLLRLRGKNFACFCPPGQPCHADVLLDLANRPTCETVPPPQQEERAS